MIDDGTGTGTGTPAALPVQPAPVPQPQPQPPKAPRLRNGTVCYLEAELRDYAATKHQLAELEGDILEGGYGVAYDVRGGRHTGPAGHGDPTGARGTRLAEFVMLRQMREVVNAIDGVVGALPTEQRQALALLYWRPNSYGSTRRVADALNVSERTIRYWRALWLGLLAARLGLR